MKLRLNPLLRRLGPAGVLGVGILFAAGAFYASALVPLDKEIAAQNAALERLQSRSPFRPASTGGREEPYETVVVDVDDEFSGTVIDKMAMRKAEMTDMRPSGGGKTRLTFSAPSRGLIGYHGEFLSDTRGTGIMNRLFEKYGPYKGSIQGRQNGVLISMEKGAAVAYALNALEERGVLFISPGDLLYEGMIIGENAKIHDLEVNPLKSKQLTNFRASGPKDEGIRLTPPRRMSLEQAIAYIQDDELVEVTPKAIRIRKRFLDPHERKRQSRKMEAA